jgi:hypothetical protein
MPRSTPADLADEIRTRGGRWSLNGARLRPPGPRGERTFDVAVAFGGGRVWTEVELDSRAMREARPAAELLERSGYELLSVRSNPFHARRPIRGMRELEAEVRRLEALSLDRGALASFPPPPELWLNLQQAVDLRTTELAVGSAVRGIKSIGRGHGRLPLRADTFVDEP